MSTKDKLERKKYMGVWSWESRLTARMMSRFPNTVIRYMERKSPNMRGCSFGSSENPRRRILEVFVFCLGPWVEVTTKKRKNSMINVTEMSITRCYSLCL